MTVFCCCVFWGSGFINPLIDQLVLRGQVYQDVLMNMSVSEMIRTYGVSSTGLHGTPYFGYHWGAHAAIGLASSILSIPVSVGYSLLLPLTAIPLLLRFLFASSAVYDVGAGSGGMLRTWFGILVLTSIVWPLVLLASPSGLPSGVPYSMPYVSESLLLSVVLSLILTTVFHYRDWSLGTVMAKVFNSRQVSTIMNAGLQIFF